MRPARHFAHRVRRIGEEIDKDLLHLQGVGDHERLMIIQTQFDFYSAAAAIMIGHAQRVANKPVDIGAGFFRGLPSHRRARAFNKFD